MKNTKNTTSTTSTTLALAGVNTRLGVAAPQSGISRGERAANDRLARLRAEVERDKAALQRLRSLVVTEERRVEAARATRRQLVKCWAVLLKMGQEERLAAADSGMQQALNRLEEARERVAACEARILLAKEREATLLAEAEEARAVAEKRDEVREAFRTSRRLSAPAPKPEPIMVPMPGPVSDEEGLEFLLAMEAPLPPPPPEPVVGRIVGGGVADLRARFARR